MPRSSFFYRVTKIVEIFSQFFLLIFFESCRTNSCYERSIRSVFYVSCTTFPAIIFSVAKIEFMKFFPVIFFFDSVPYVN